MTTKKHIRRYTRTIGVTVFFYIYKGGKSVDEITAGLNMSHNTVFSYMPYIKCMYNAEYSSKNVLQIRDCKERKIQRGLNIS